MEKFSEDIERLAGEQRELTKASSKAKAAATRADAAVTKLRGKIADLESERQVRGSTDRDDSPHRLEMVSSLICQGRAAPSGHSTSSKTYEPTHMAHW